MSIFPRGALYHQCVQKAKKKNKLLQIFALFTKLPTKNAVSPSLPHPQAVFRRISPDPKVLLFFHQKARRTTVNGAVFQRVSLLGKCYKIFHDPLTCTSIIPKILCKFHPVPMLFPALFRPNSPVRHRPIRQRENFCIHSSIFVLYYLY